MVRIILNGCSGRMGKAITGAAESFSELTIVAGIDKQVINSAYPIFENILKCTVEADVILDFSRPDTLADLISYAKQKKLPIVICTTGFTKEQELAIEESSKEIAIFRSGNMSFGINVINNILKQVSSLLYENFDIEIIEKHHNQKVDAPSGTALLLADTIKSVLPEETSYVYGREGIAKRTHKEIGIHAIRGGSIVGEHEVIFAGQGETITIKHEALSRDVFAVGALKASAFMADKKNGRYSMDDVIQETLKK